MGSVGKLQSTETGKREKRDRKKRKLERLNGGKRNALFKLNDQ